MRAEVVAEDRAPWRARTPSPETAILIGLTVLAAVLRFATLTTQSYWFDEAQAAHEMQLSFGALLHTIGNQETSPPLYFVLAWLWAKVFGIGEAGLRSLSAVLGVAVIPVTYLCGRELVSRRAGLVAAALAAVSPFMLWYSQEAREYMLLAATCGASLLFFARALRRPDGRTLALWAAFSGLALLSHFFAGFLVAPEALWLLIRHRTRATALAVGAVVVVEAALLPLAISDTGHPIGWLSAIPRSTRIQQVPVSFALGTLDRSSLLGDGLLGAAVLAGVLIFLLVAGADRDELRGAGIAATLAGVVVLVPLLIAVAGHDFYIDRAVIPAWIPLAVVIGAACTTAPGQDPGGDPGRRDARVVRRRPGPDRRPCRLPAPGLARGGRGARALGPAAGDRAVRGVARDRSAQALCARRPLGPARGCRPGPGGRRCGQQLCLARRAAARRGRAPITA